MQDTSKDEVYSFKDSDILVQLANIPVFNRVNICTYNTNTTTIIHSNTLK